MSGRTCPTCHHPKEYGHLFCRSCWFLLPTLLRERLSVKKASMDSRLAYLEAARFLTSLRPTTKSALKRATPISPLASLTDSELDAFSDAVDAGCLPVTQEEK